MQTWEIKNTVSNLRAIMCYPIDRARIALQNHLESNGYTETLKKLDRSSFEIIIRLPPYRALPAEDWGVLYDAFMDHKEDRNGCRPQSPHESYKYFMETLKQPLSILSATADICKGHHDSDLDEVIERGEKIQAGIEKFVVTNPQIYGYTSRFDRFMFHLLYDIPPEEVGIKIRLPETSKLPETTQPIPSGEFQIGFNL